MNVTGANHALQHWGANPFRTNLSLHFHQMTSASCSAVQITPRNGRHDDATLTTFSGLALVLPGTDWLYQFTNNLTALTTANGGALTNLGITLLSTIAFFQLVNMVISFSTANMTVSLNHTPLDAGEIVRFLLRLTMCCLLETYWVNPLPGAGFRP